MLRAGCASIARYEEFLRRSIFLPLMLELEYGRPIMTGEF
jgi:hypothetical protein